jgi:hypothetical protein
LFQRNSAEIVILSGAKNLIPLKSETLHGACLEPDSSRDGDQEIYVMNPDGTNVMRLTNNTVVEKDPDWMR